MTKGLIFRRQPAMQHDPDKRKSQINQSKEEEQKLEQMLQNLNQAPIESHRQQQHHPQHPQHSHQHQHQPVQSHLWQNKSILGKTRLYRL